jgi:hypothetical protein
LAPIHTPLVTDPVLNDISIFVLFPVLLLFPILTLLFFQQLIKRSRSKDQYIRVTLKRLTEMHFVDDDLTDKKALNQMVLAKNEELENQLVAEIQEKTSKSTLSINLTMPKRYLG